MMKKPMKVAGIVMTAAVLASAVAPAQASGQLPIYKACLAKAKTAQDPKAARDQCVWDHWEMMAEYG
jgi:hypothetical protein